MEDKMQLNYAGCLAEELNEIDRVIAEKGSAEDPDSLTAHCGILLTIFCC